jgi:nucleotide-binding universal stress UspA family protein
MISLLYVMARDQELPEHFTELNNFGVPWLALIFATVLPVLVLNLDDSVEGLAALYAIGVVGAITINLGSCVFAKQLPLRKGERRTMAVTSFILAAVWITIAVTKLGALAFVVAVLIAGLTVRELTQRRLRRRAERAPAASPSTTLTVAPNGKDAPPVLGTRILVAARGWTPALQFALEAARLRGASLLVLYIREVNVLIEYSANWKDDPQARKLFHRITAAVPDLQINPLYSVSDSPADTITDIAATFAVDTVILGGSKRATLVNLLRGNVVTRVASNLPDSIRLVVIG